MGKVAWLLLVPTATLSTFAAEPRCPGNIASVALHLVNRYLFMVQVTIDHSSPYNFLLDTGTQTTTVDTSLAAELHLSLQGSPVIDGIGFQAKASSARLDLVDVGAHAVPNQKALVYDLHNVQAAGLPIRGVLGEDFLEHFDMLLDNAHSMLCLDDSGAMRAGMKGSHTPLASQGKAAGIDGLSRSLIIEAHLSDQAAPVRLWLDSGTNASLLFKPSESLAGKLDRTRLLDGTGGNAAQTSYLPLPAQDMKVALLKLQKVTFLTPATAQKNHQVTEFDGLLTTWLFRRVFVDHDDRFAVLEPW